MNKEQALKEIEKLKNNITELELIINKPIDLFSIDTYSKVCKKLNEKEYTLEDFSFLPIEDQENILVKTQIRQIEKLFNSKKLDWKDINIKKYYPWFHSDGGGFCFHGSCCNFSCFHSFVAYYETKEICDFIGKTFIHLYEKLTK